ncbi:MAG: hypothetical protein NXI32_28275 [bacterium]|nr:hypothetical protein [bacterium]
MHFREAISRWHLGFLSPSFGPEFIRMNFYRQPNFRNLICSDIFFVIHPKPQRATLAKGRLRNVGLSKSEVGLVPQIEIFVPPEKDSSKPAWRAYTLRRTMEATMATLLANSFSCPPSSCYSFFGPHQPLEG